MYRGTFFILNFIFRHLLFLSLAEKHRPDLIVLDFDLGDCKGSEVCAKIKAHAELGKTPVIILTNFAGAMPQALAEGKPEQFVVKDTNPFELMSVIELLLPPAPNAD